MQGYDKMARVVCPPPNTRSTPSVTASRLTTRSGDATPAQLHRAESDGMNKSKTVSGGIVGSNSALPNKNVHDIPVANSTGAGNSASAKAQKGDDTHTQKGCSQVEGGGGPYHPGASRARGGGLSRRREEVDTRETWEGGQRQNERVHGGGGRWRHGRKRRRRKLGGLGNIRAWASYGAVAVVGLTIVVVVFIGGNESGREQAGTFGGTFWSSVLYCCRAWALSLLIVSAIGGSTWLSVRVARWREEVMAFSPIVPEALVRANATVGEYVNSDSTCHERKAGSDGYSSGTRARVFAEIVDDPVARVFGANTEAGSAFDSCARASAHGCGNSQDAPAIPPSASGADGDVKGGEVVFLTGATGLVGQMVLYDLLRLGSAISSSTGAKSANAAAIFCPAGTKLEPGEENEDFPHDHKGVKRNNDDFHEERCCGNNSKEPGEGRLKHVFVMIRHGKRGKSAAERLQALKESPMFLPLLESGAWVEDNDSDKQQGIAVGIPTVGATVTVVEGDLAKEGLGLTADSRAMLARARVTRALHCAASVRFSDPLAEAAATNVAGALRVAALVASWPTCRTLVHVSTAFVHGRNCGTPEAPLPQKLPDLGGRDPEKLYRGAQNASSTCTSKPPRQSSAPGVKSAMEAIRELGYPNTYTFTKAIGEHLLARAIRAHNRRIAKSHRVSTHTAFLSTNGDTVADRNDELGTELVDNEDVDGCGEGEIKTGGVPCRLRLRIVRPSIVGPSWVFPWAGWTGEQPSTVTGCLVLLLQRAVKTFRLSPHPAPVIPVDVVSRAIVHSALGWGAGSRSSVAARTPISVRGASPAHHQETVISSTRDNGDENLMSSSTAARVDSATADRSSGMPAMCNRSPLTLLPEVGKESLDFAGQAPQIVHMAEHLLVVRKDDGDDNVDCTSRESSSSVACDLVTSSTADSASAAGHENSSASPTSVTPVTRTQESTCGLPSSGAFRQAGVVADEAEGKRKLCKNGLRSGRLAANDEAADRLGKEDDVVIRNLAWATSPIVSSCKAGSCAPLVANVRNRSGDPETRDLEVESAWESGSGDVIQGRMPSFREFSGLLYDYAVVRGLRASMEAAAVRTALSIASTGLSSRNPERHDDECLARGEIADVRCNDGEQRQTWGRRTDEGSRGFWLLHTLLDQSPVWALRCVAAVANRLPKKTQRRDILHDGETRTMTIDTGGSAMRPHCTPPTVRRALSSTERRHMPHPNPRFAPAPCADRVAPSNTISGIPNSGESEAKTRLKPFAHSSEGSESAGASIATTLEKNDEQETVSFDSDNDNSSLSCLGEGEETEGAEFPGASGRGTVAADARAGRRRLGLEVAAERLDRLAVLPAVYEPFTCRPYFFDSALRVPRMLAPVGYALETALASELLQRGLPGGIEAGAKASSQRRSSLLEELGLQIEAHRAGGLRCGNSTDFHRPATAMSSNPPAPATVGNSNCDKSASRGSLSRPSPSTTLPLTEPPDRLTFLSRRSDRLVPWPALAWWAATLPGSAARGGITLWVRVVAFCVRAVLSRAASGVAVDMQSFVAASPPGYATFQAAGDSDCFEDGEEGGVKRGGCRKGLGGGRGAVQRRGEEIKEDGMLMVDGIIARDATDSDSTRIGDGAGGTNGGIATDGQGDTDEGDGVRTGDGDELGAGMSARCRYPKMEGTAGESHCGNRRGRKSDGAGVVVVLLPTHRSYLDFVLVSLLCAAMRFAPGLSWLRVPKVAAAEGPFGKKGSPLRWLLEKLGAFFVQRGRGEADSTLQDRLEAMRYEEGCEERSEQRCRDRSWHGTNGRFEPASSVNDGNNTGSRTSYCDAEPSSRLGENVREGGWPGPSDSDPLQKGLETLEVFVEGTRSRDRRFLAPKTGLLRALQAAREGATLWLVPVSISYERVPEQIGLSQELASAGQDAPSGGGGGLWGLFRWTMKALSGRVRLGRVFMRAGEPVALHPGGDVPAAVAEVRRQHRLNTVITPYHVQAASSHFGLPEGDVRECVRALGGVVWEDDGDGDDQKNPFETGATGTPSTRPHEQSTLSYASDVTSTKARKAYAPHAPDRSKEEAWMCHLQWLHLLEDGLRQSRKAEWADWLVPPPPPSSTIAVIGNQDHARGHLPLVLPLTLASARRPSSTTSARTENDAVQRVLNAVLHRFDAAEKEVFRARQALLERGFSKPTPEHILQSLKEEEKQKLFHSESGETCVSRTAVKLELEGFERVGRHEGSQMLRRSSDEETDVQGIDVEALSDRSDLFLASAALSLENDRDTAGHSSLRSTGVGLGNEDAVPTAGSDDEDGEGDGWFGAADGDKEAFGSWGFRDSGFALASDVADRNGEPHVVMRGGRYGICGRPLRGLLPFVREAVGVPISARGRASRACTPKPPLMPPSRLLKPAEGNYDGMLPESAERGTDKDVIEDSNDSREGLKGRTRQTLLASLVAAIGSGFNIKQQVSVVREERARHGTGHGLSDVWALRSGKLSRAPDAVVWPTSEEQVSALMQWAGKEGVCLIPFGGGTSVTRALEVPSLDVEPRPVISVDMRKMCRILSFDAENGTAHVEAGVVGRKLSSELALRGVTMGHEPDSLEFSTLGGWVATKASGMKRGRYGNIEDIVLEVRVATGRGLGWQHCDRHQGRRARRSEKPAAPFARTSVGLDLTSAMLGSEGCLGIITSVVIKVVPLPEVSEHASFFFRNFATGVAFCRELSMTSGRLGLASCRLLDNSQLRLGRAMKGDEAETSDSEGVMMAIKRLAPAGQLLYIRLVKGWDPKNMSAVTMVFEGSKSEASAQKKEVSRIARAHGGMSGGASAGKSGYDLTFAIAYLRDFALLFDVLGESFETFVAWSALEGLCERVRERVAKEHRARGLRGHAFVTHRVTQLYPEGACVYFYLAIYAEGVRNPPVVFAELEEAARDEILTAGGSLSHHHGVGKARAGFMSRISSAVVAELVRGLKRALDPENVLGARNHVFAQD